MSIEAILAILIGIIVGVSGQVAYLLLIDHEMMKESKGKIKELQQQMKQLQPGSEQFKQVYSQVLAENSKMMKQSFKPTYVTIVPFIIVFLVMSYYLSVVPISTGSSVNAILSGSVNGTLSFSKGCVTISNSSNLTIVSANLPQSFTAKINSATCTAFLTNNNATHNTSLSGLIGARSTVNYKIDNLSIAFSPNPVIVGTLPFSIPFIGNTINWFWAYVFFSFVSSIALNRVFKHYKMVS
ncbi:MAG: EMC3/TMCO1 family protein [Candidatus Parvarchaeota archaeon]|nr:EMC3/TMCO1 family protein [Candidatus Parvarchaeota archaeon]